MACCVRYTGAIPSFNSNPAPRGFAQPLTGGTVSAFPVSRMPAFWRAAERCSTELLLGKLKHAPLLLHHNPIIIQQFPSRLVHSQDAGEVEGGHALACPEVAQ